MRSICVQGLYIEDDSDPSQCHTVQATLCRGADSSDMLDRRASNRRPVGMENRVLVLHISGRWERRSQ
jgi:hypothetical protein